MDMKNESFFGYVERGFFDQARGQRYMGSSYDEGIIGLGRNKSWPNVWSQVDRLGKAMVSTNYRDLGQWQLPSQANMLSTPESLRYWTANFSTILLRKISKFSALALEKVPVKAAVNSCISNPKVISSSFVKSK
ncbi:MAG: hypothetical protein EOO88_41485 [Pedobacter sp.]|nr:MAG: hypothetical protein EOO88_41485 [Pedobacter sp.]